MGSYNYYKMFGCFNRKFKISESEPPPDVLRAFSKYSPGGTQMTSDQFMRFLVEYQGEEGCTLGDAEKIMNQVIHIRHHLTILQSHRGLSLEDFFYYLLDPDLNGPIKSQVHHDMTAPMQHYFIYTGHNSYLTGNQLSSDCSEIPIVKALERGVRGIELDLWPNSSRDDVHVLHGSSVPFLEMTSQLIFTCDQFQNAHHSSNTCEMPKSIKQHAFVKSPYPVIITLEDHLTAELQAKVAEMVIQVFGDMLYYPDSGCLEEFPSPELLKHRIILSTKPPKEYKEGESSSPGEKEKDLVEEENLVKEICEQTTESETSSRGESDQDDEDSDVQSQKSGQLAAPKYKRLIAIHAGKAKSNLKNALTTGIGKVNRLSLSEQSLEKAASAHGTDVVRFTQRNILRIYPKGTRVTSSNFKPLTAWMHGAQMVAFNMQGYGKSLWLMHGMFRANGGCGYVKKPEFLMSKAANDKVFDPKLKLPARRTLQVNVYLGDGWRLDFSHTHFDSYSPPDFYTKIYIVGAPADYAKKKTRIIEDDWGPMWNEEFFFPLTMPELALLRIEVREHDLSEKDDFGGQTCLPVSELRQGIRAVPLYDKKGEKLKSVRLLMRFQLL